MNNEDFIANCTRLTYHKVADKADYIADIARDIAYNKENLSITEQAQAMDILRQLQNIADFLDEIAPTFQTDED